MVDRLRMLSEGRQQDLSGGSPGRALGIAGVESGQGLLLFSQLVPHLVFQQAEQADR